MTRNRWIPIYLVVFGLLAASRFVSLSERPLHNDEGVNGFFTLNLVRSNTYRYDPTNYHGPSLYYAQLVTSRIFQFIEDPLHFRWSDTRGVTVFSMRFTIAAVSLLLFVVFLLNRNFLGAWGTFVAVLFLGVSPNILYYSRYFIHEIFVVLFSLGVVLWGWRFGLERRAKDFFVCGLCAVLLLCTKETGVLHLVVTSAAYVGAIAISNRLSGRSLAETGRALRDDGATYVDSVPKALPLIVVALVAVWFLLFSSFFTNFAGLKDFFLAYAPWLKQGLKSGHEKVWHYFFTKILGPYEYGLLFAALLSIVPVIGENSPKGWFLLLWSFGTFALYSAIPYKTPWCVVNIVMPLAVFSGYGFQQWLEWMHSQQRYSVRKRFGGAALAAMMVAVFSQVPRAWTLNFIEPANARHPQVYVHTSPDIFNLIRRIGVIANTANEPKKILVNVFAKEYWPIPFYLKDYSEVKFWGQLAKVSPMDAPLIIANQDQHSQLRALLQQTYTIETYRLRDGYSLDLWINNKNLEQLDPAQAVPDLLRSSLKTALKPGVIETVFPRASCNGGPLSSKSVRPQFSFFYNDNLRKPFPSPGCVQWDGYVKIPETGVTRFILESDDGSKLSIDGVLVVDNWGSHSNRRASRNVNISAGYHKFELQYNDVGGFAELNLLWREPSAAGLKQERPIPETLFSH